MNFLIKKRKNISDGGKAKNRNKEEAKNILDVCEKYFSKDYFEARQKFLRASKEKNLTIIQKKIIGDLTTDVAISRSMKKDKLLIIVSGVHGVEGYVGSAFQLFFLENYLDKIKNDFSVMLIHAYNPYGFYAGRRVNENNVDLNRNCLTDFKLNEQQQKVLSIIKESKKLFLPEKARGSEIVEKQKQNLMMFRTLIKSGIKKTILAGVSGQNLYPLGANFIGNKKEESTLFFQELLEIEASKYDSVFLLDVHTGLGTKHNISTYTYNLPKSIEWRLLKRINKRTKSTKGITTIPHSGSLAYYFMNNTNIYRRMHLLLEFGTVSSVSIALSLNKLSKINVAENQITHFGPASKLEKIRKDIKKAYYPNTKKFRFIAILKSKHFLDKLCEEYRKM